ncbi:MAG: hypothetical protein ACKN9I_06745 [Alphaproteobacteria bacterium]
MSNADNKSYRKGLIMGLTMSEITIMIIFVLLLAFSFFIKKEQRKVEKYKKNEESIERLVNFIEKKEQPLTEELVQGLEKLPEIKKLVEKRNKLPDKEEVNLDQLLQKMREDLEQEIKESELVKELENPLAPVVPPILTKEKKLENEIKELINEKINLSKKINNLEGQNIHLIRKVKGIGFPPCWAKVNGNPEYIFNVYLRDDGILILNNNLPNRQQDQANLNLNIAFGNPLSPSEMRSQTKQLLDYGKKNQCRFFVQVIDHTSANQKDLYKDLRQAVESNFYILKLN